jgi:Protein of unknown function (DUF3788)
MGPSKPEGDLQKQTMSKSSFIDKNHQPSEAEIVAILSSVLTNWNLTLEGIRAVGKTQEDLKFMYGKPYGWGIRFRLKGKLLTALYPNQNHFVVQIIIDSKRLKEVDHIHLHPNAQEAIQNANPYPEGKWLFIKTETRANVEDVKELLKLRMKSI